MTTFSLSSADGLSEALDGVGTKDGLGGGDHDQAYTFGRRPRAVAPFPFNQRQYAKLLVVRGCIRDGLRGADDLQPSGATFARPLPESYPDEVARAILETAGVLVLG